MRERSREARRHERAPILGTAIITREGDAGQVVAIDNLSAGGALVCASADVQPGTWVHVLLCLPGSVATTLSALVLRHAARDDGTWQLALMFDHVAPVVEEWLRKRVALALERQNVASAEGQRGLLVGPDSGDRESMLAELRALGFSVLVVDSVPEAVPFLGQQPSPFEFIAVDAMSEAADGVDLLAMARRIYPELRCILMGTAAETAYLEREGKFLERSVLLLRPWSLEDLRKAVTGS